MHAAAAPIAVSPQFQGGPRPYVICQYPVGDLLLDVHGYLDSADYGHEITSVTLAGDSRDLCDLFDTAGLRGMKAYCDENVGVSA